MRKVQKMIYPAFMMAIESDDDRQFMLRLYEDHYPFMIREAKRILRGDDAAEDIVSDACVSLIGHIKTLQALSSCKLRAYVVSTIRNACFSFLKKRNRRDRYTLYDAEDALMNAQSTEPPVDHRLIYEAEIGELKASLRKLPEREMSLLEMKYFLQWTDSEIAEWMGIQPDSVRQYLTAARRHLVQIMAQEHSI